MAEPLCAWCRETMTPGVRHQGGGPARRFCSPACKQAEYRHRRDPERYPDAQTWAVRRLHSDAGLDSRP